MLGANRFDYEDEGSKQTHMTVSTRQAAGIRGHLT